MDCSFQLQFLSSDSSNNDMQDQQTEENDNMTNC